MNAETSDYLAKARAALADARQIENLPLPHIAAREAYLAAFHAAEAYIFEITGKIAKKHRGVRTEFSRLARAEPRLTQELVSFLGSAYELKTQTDYAVGSNYKGVSTAEADCAIATAARLIQTIEELLLEKP